MTFVMRNRRSNGRRSYGGGEQTIAGGGGEVVTMAAAPPPTTTYPPLPPPPLPPPFTSSLVSGGGGGAGGGGGGVVKMLLSAMAVVAVVALRAAAAAATPPSPPPPLAVATIAAAAAAVVASSSSSSPSPSSSSSSSLSSSASAAKAAKATAASDVKDPILSFGILADADAKGKPPPHGDKVDGSDDAAAGTLKNFYSFTAKDIDDNTVHLSKFKGMVTLVVNVASECGFTHRNYEGLVQMQRNFGSKRFSILAFPCNQFGEQEPGENWEIESFAQKLYNINFPLFAKTDIIGSKAAASWNYLTKSSGKEPNWNFWKYLVDGNGLVTNVWGQKTSFSEIYRHIHHVLKGGHQQKKKIVHTDL